MLRSYRCAAGDRSFINKAALQLFQDILAGGNIDVTNEVSP